MIIRIIFLIYNIYYFSFVYDFMRKINYTFFKIVFLSSH